MNDARLINSLHDEPRYDRIWNALTVEEKRKVLDFAEGCIWNALTVEEKRKVLDFAEGELSLAKVALEDAKEEAK